MNLIKDETDGSEVSKIRALTRVARAQIEFSWKIEHFSFCSKKQEVLGESGALQGNWSLPAILLVFILIK